MANHRSQWLLGSINKKCGGIAQATICNRHHDYLSLVKACYKELFKKAVSENKESSSSAQTATCNRL
eukprot:133666-Pelagomonas_calceolata.AAC.1